MARTKKPKSFVDILDKLIGATNDKLEKNKKKLGINNKIVRGNQVLESDISTTISCGIPCIDRICAIDDDDRYGFPIGKTVKVNGKEHSAKSLLLKTFARNIRVGNHVVLYFDPEESFSRRWSRKISLKPEEVALQYPDDTAEFVETMKEFIINFTKMKEKGEIPAETKLFIFLDSVSQLSDRGENQKEFGSSSGIAGAARDYSRMFRVMTKRFARAGVCFVAIGQTKQNVGVMYGPKDATYGGDSFKFNSSITLDFRYMGRIKKGDKIIGTKIKVANRKNKCGVHPFHDTDFIILFDTGVHYDYALFKAMIIDGGVIRKSGWYYTIKVKGAKKKKKISDKYKYKFRVPEEGYPTELEKLLEKNPKIKDKWMKRLYG